MGLSFIIILIFRPIVFLSLLLLYSFSIYKTNKQFELKILMLYKGGNSHGPIESDPLEHVVRRVVAVHSGWIVGWCLTHISCLCLAIDPAFDIRDWGSHCTGVSEHTRYF